MSVEADILFEQKVVQYSVQQQWKHQDHLTQGVFRQFVCVCVYIVLSRQKAKISNQGERVLRWI